RSRITYFHVLTVSEELPPVIANVGRERDGHVSQMSENLVETDVYVADDSLHSDVARQTGKPPRSSDTDFPWWRSFAPALFHRHNFFRIIFSVGSKRVRAPKKNRGTAKENCHQNEIDGFVSCPVIHGLLSTCSA